MSQSWPLISIIPSRCGRCAPNWINNASSARPAPEQPTSNMTVLSFSASHRRSGNSFLIVNAERQLSNSINAVAPPSVTQCHHPTPGPQPTPPGRRQAEEAGRTIRSCGRSCGCFARVTAMPRVVSQCGDPDAEPCALGCSTPPWNSE